MHGVRARRAVVEQERVEANVARAHRRAEGQPARVGAATGGEASRTGKTAFTRAVAAKQKVRAMRWLVLQQHPIAERCEEEWPRPRAA